MTILDWAPGDTLGPKVPAHAEALRQGGADYLTEAFRASGALTGDNSVAAITQFEECPGGSTGRKLLLSVRYGRDTNLPTALFAKFSRDFSDPVRDRGKDQLEAEVRLALLSRAPNFPIPVPKCLYADYHRASGTGVLITERIAFGQNGLERAYDKCVDYEIKDPLAHYRAIIAALARLAGAHRAGLLGADIEAQFPFDPYALSASDPIRYSAEQLQTRATRLGAFGALHPHLLPANIVAPAFIARLSELAPRFLAAETEIKAFLNANRDHIALCHWNANIDNAYFWRDQSGEMQCGLMDWGRVGQMNVALAIWGALSAAEIELWDNHLDDLLMLFVSEFEDAGGPRLDVAEIKFHLDLFVAMLGLAWLMDAPALIHRQIPDLHQSITRLDPRIRRDEMARTQVHMVGTFLNLWDRHDFGAVLDEFERRQRTHL